MTDQSEERVTEVSQQLATFIVDDLEYDGTTQDLLGEEPVDLPSILDSSDLLELAGFLEDKFGIVIDDEEIVAETFASVRMLAQMVVAKQATPDATA